MSLASSFNSLESFFAKIGSCLQSPLLLVIRLYWGWSFVLTGWGKLTHLDRTAGYFASLGLPAAKLQAALVGGVETVGGALLLLGLFSRLVSPVLVFITFMAYFLADRSSLFAIVSDGDKFTGAVPFLFLFASLIVWAFGPGKFSLDALVRKKV